MNRAQLIMNPEARGVTPAMRRVVEAALQARFKLDSVTTHARDEAIAVARDAVDAGAELIVAFGGDGLVNEVANGVAGTDTALAIVPGGTMNVLARNLGLPRGILEATDRILQAAGQSKPVEIKVGKANDRLFTFSCGCGFDADVALWVENHRFSKRRFGEPYFYAAGFLTFLREYATRPPFLRCQGEFGREEGVSAIALNSGTYAYLAGRQVRLGTTKPVRGRLDLFLLKQMRLTRLPNYAIGAFVNGNFGSDALSATGLESFTVEGDLPFSMHCDGEPLSPQTSVTLSVPAETLRVLI
jgi:diacylglycerol kinase family enzyme